jgi:hypothetical protein
MKNKTKTLVDELKFGEQSKNITNFDKGIILSNLHLKHLKKK